MLGWRRRTENWSLNLDNCRRHISERCRGEGEEGRGKERMKKEKGKEGERGDGKEMRNTEGVR